MNTPAISKASRGTIRAVILLTLMPWLVMSQRVFAHEDATVHPWLTRAAIDVLNAHFGPPQFFSQANIEAIVQGSIDEDDQDLDNTESWLPVAPSPLRHFYHPWSGVGMPDPVGGGHYQSARASAAEHWQWMVDAFNANPGNNGYNGPFHLLGQILHLLQDMTSPAHVHLDAHPPGNADVFEEWTPGHLPGIPVGLTPHIGGSGSVEGFIHELAMFTFNRTTFQGELVRGVATQPSSELQRMFPDPDTGLRWRGWGLDKWYIDGVGDFDGTPSAEDNWWYEATPTLSIDAPSGIILRISGEFYMESANVRIQVWERPTTHATVSPGDSLLEIYARELLPETVRCCAGLLRMAYCEIRGQVRDRAGAPVSGIAIKTESMDGTSSYFATTDAAGNYILQVHRGWSGRVLPSPAEPDWNPQERRYADLQGDVSAQDFAIPEPFTPMDYELVDHEDHATYPYLPTIWPLVLNEPGAVLYAHVDNDARPSELLMWQDGRLNGLAMQGESLLFTTWAMNDQGTVALWDVSFGDSHSGSPAPSKPFLSIWPRGVSFPSSELFADTSPPRTAMEQESINCCSSEPFEFAVTYTDEGAGVDAASLRSTNITVERPGANDQDERIVARFVGYGPPPEDDDARDWFVPDEDDAPERIPVVGVYAIDPPGGTWDHADNGSYRVYLEPNEVFDLAIPVDRERQANRESPEFPGNTHSQRCSLGTIRVVLPEICREDCEPRRSPPDVVQDPSLSEPDPAGRYYLRIRPLFIAGPQWLNDRGQALFGGAIDPWFEEQLVVSFSGTSTFDSMPNPVFPPGPDRSFEPKVFTDDGETLGLWRKRAIRKYAAGFGSFEDLLDVTHFEEFRSYEVSRDGRVVVLDATLEQQGADALAADGRITLIRGAWERQEGAGEQAWRLPTGDGIFALVEHDGAYYLTRIVGCAVDGVVDPGELWHMPGSSGRSVVPLDDHEDDGNGIITWYESLGPLRVSAMDDKGVFYVLHGGEPFVDNCDAGPCPSPYTFPLQYLTEVRVEDGQSIWPARAVPQAVEITAAVPMPILAHDTLDVLNDLGILTLPGAIDQIELPSEAVNQAGQIGCKILMIATGNLPYMPQPVITAGSGALVRASRRPHPRALHVITPGFGVGLLPEYDETLERLGRQLEAVPANISPLRGNVRAYVHRWEPGPEWEEALAAYLMSIYYSHKAPPEPEKARAALQQAEQCMEMARTYAQAIAYDIVETLVFRGWLTPSTPATADDQVIHLIGHGRGAAISAMVAAQLASMGYQIHQFTAIDGLGTDWPHGAGLLGDIDIHRELRSLHQNGDVLRCVNYLVEEGLEASVLDILAPLLGLNSDQLPVIRQALFELKAPYRRWGLFDNIMITGVHGLGVDMEIPSDIADQIPGLPPGMDISDIINDIPGLPPGVDISDLIGDIPGLLPGTDISDITGQIPGWLDSGCDAPSNHLNCVQYYLTSLCRPMAFDRYILDNYVGQNVADLPTCTLGCSSFIPASLSGDGPP